LRTTLIIAKDERVIARFPLFALLAASALAGLASAQTAGSAPALPTASSDASDLALAKREALEATERSVAIEREAAHATDEAARARAEAAALAARIEASEADITAGEARIRIIEALRAQQRARLALRQKPIIRLTAALQTMTRRPAALALVQPGSIDDVVHVRSLLASTLPIIRARTAGLRAEMEAGDALRRQAGQAVDALIASREQLQQRRIALARFEASQRLRSQSLVESAMFQSDRALAFDEEARELGAKIGTREYQARIRRSLADLPGPLLRPLRPGEAPPTPPDPGQHPLYILPVSGRMVTGMGEISEAGVHSRGITLETQGWAQVVAPAPGRIAYAGAFRGYGGVVIIEHAGGWSSTITRLGEIGVRVGDSVHRGDPIAHTATGQPHVTIELRRGGRPFPIAPLMSLGSG
jgi:septal ring factor EnvC (AmiA/AmiB activator)